MPPSIRTIREEPEFWDDLRAVLQNPAPVPQLIDDMLEGVTFTIARDPTKGSRIYPTPIWVIAQPLPPLGQTLRIYYEFNEDTVVLRAATVK